MKTRPKIHEDTFYNWHITSENKKHGGNFVYKSAIKHLRNNYSNPKSGISFAGVNKIYNYYNKVIPLKDIKEFLSKDDSYTLHTRAFKKQCNPSFIRYKKQQMQTDLINVGSLSPKNDGVKFLLTLICCVTKRERS